MGDRGWRLGASLVITLEVVEDSIGAGRRITGGQGGRERSIGGIYNDEGGERDARCICM